MSPQGASTNVEWVSQVFIKMRTHVPMIGGHVSHRCSPEGAAPVHGTDRSCSVWWAVAAMIGVASPGSGSGLTEWESGACFRLRCWGSVGLSRGRRWRLS